MSAVKKYRGTGETIRRNEAGFTFIHPAMIYTVAVCTFALIPLAVFDIWCIYQKDIVTASICSGVILFCVLFGVYCDHLEWCRNVEYVFDKRAFRYYYDLDSAVLPVGKPEVEITFQTIDAVQMENGRIVIYGDGMKRMPMRKPQTLKKYRLAADKQNDMMVMARLQTYVKQKVA